jgi:hypothetical protein
MHHACTTWQVVARMDAHEFATTWLANKAIYRTRMAIADGGEGTLPDAALESERGAWLHLCSVASLLVGVVYHSMLLNALQFCRRNRADMQCSALSLLQYCCTCGPGKAQMHSRHHIPPSCAHAARIRLACFTTRR